MEKTLGNWGYWIKFCFQQFVSFHIVFGCVSVDAGRYAYSVFGSRSFFCSFSFPVGHATPLKIDDQVHVTVLTLHKLSCHGSDTALALAHVHTVPAFWLRLDM